MKSNKREIYADYLRVLSIIAVILTHITGTVVVNYFDNQKWWWLANVLNSSSRWAVPVMIMISGAFIIEKANNISIIEFWKKNIKKILYPLLFWSIVYYIVISWLNGEVLSVKFFLLKLIKDDINYTFWFMYLIIQIYLICPIIAPFICKASNRVFKYILIFWGILAFGDNLLTLFGISLRLPFDIFNGYNAYLGYFILGYYCNKFEFKQIAVKITYVIGLISIILTIFGNYFIMRYNNGVFSGEIYSNFSISTLGVSLSIFMLFKKEHYVYFINRNILNKLNKIIINISKLTFGMYLVHDLILRILSSGKLGVVIAFFGTFTPYINIPLTLSSTFIISSLVTYLLKKSFFYRVI